MIKTGLDLYDLIIKTVIVMRSDLITTSTISKDHCIKTGLYSASQVPHVVRIESHALCYYEKDRSL